MKRKRVPIHILSFLTHTPHITLLSHTHSPIFSLFSLSILSHFLDLKPCFRSKIGGFGDVYDVSVCDKSVMCD